MNIVPGPKPFVELVTHLLSRGYRVRFRAEGVSMLPTIRGGDAITIEPISEVKMGDIALYRVERGLIAHRIVGIRKKNGKAPVFLARGEAANSSEEAVHEQQVLGKVVAIDRNGRSLALGGRWAKMRCRARRFVRSARHWGAMFASVHVRGAGVFLLVSALVAVFPNSARANISVTEVSSSGSSSSGNTCVITGVDTSTNSPNLVLIGLSTNANAVSTPTISPAGGTFTLQSSSFTGSARFAMWSLTGFSTSTSATITINMSGASGSVCGDVAFSGVASVGTTVTATGTGTTTSVTGIANPGTGGVVVDVLGVAAGSVTATPDAANGQVAQWGGSVTPSGRSGDASVAGPTTSMSWTLSSSQAWIEAAVPLNPETTTEVQPTSFTVIRQVVRNQIQNVIVLNTGREVNSLGFNLYREQNGRRVKLNSSLLAGTALLAGSGTTLTAGHVHTWWDAPSGGSSASYWVEEVDLRGARTWYGPATPVTAPAVRSGAVNLSALTTDAKGQVVLLSQVGQETGAPGTGIGSTSHVLQARAVPKATTAQNTELEYALAAGPAVKIGVQSEGWYSVSWSSLVAAGLPANVNANSLQLYAEGVPQSILVHPQSDIEFYGTGIDTTWSGTRIYWLTWGTGSGSSVQAEALPKGISAGAASLRLRPRVFQPLVMIGPSSFLSTVEWMPRTVYFAALLDGDGSNNFFGPVLESGDPVTQAIAVTNLSGNAAAGAQLQVALQGVSATAHSVEVALNGTQVGTVTFSNQAEGVATLAVPNAALVNGQNTLTLTVDDGDEDISVVDNVELTYPHTYTADADSLRFTAPGGESETIGGFSNSQISVVDITNPEAVTVVPGTITQQAGGYGITITPQGAGTRTLLAFTSAQEAQPASVTAHHPSSWHAQAGYDMVMISHADFVQSLTPLATLHQGQGLNTAVIDVEDLYDEFNFGEKSPNALKSFLSTANTQWQTKPRFVMLVGDATFDPRNYLGAGDFDFVPTYLIDTTLLQTASDDWYADFAGNGIPQMAIGRLPVRTAQQASALVSKIINYDNSGEAGWKQQVLLVADTNDSSDDFQGDAAAVKALLPANLTVSEISENESGASELLLNSLNEQGAGMVDYMGHGSEQVWSNSLFSTTNANGLTNGSMVPFVVDMTCLNGYFQDIYATALAKALLEAPGGGALAVWASSGLTASGDQAGMNQALITALYGAQPLTIGEAAASAKSATTDIDVRRTWILFGDPATKLQ